MFSICMYMWQASENTSFYYFSMNFLKALLPFWSNLFFHVNTHPFIFLDTLSTVHRPALIYDLILFYVLSMTVLFDGWLTYCSLSLSTYFLQEDNIIQNEGILSGTYISTVSVVEKRSLLRKHDNVLFLVNILWNIFGHSLKISCTSTQMINAIFGDSPLKK